MKHSKTGLIAQARSLLHAHCLMFVQGVIVNSAMAHCRGVLCAGFWGPASPPLAGGCQGGHCGPHFLHQQGPHCARTSGSHLLAGTHGCCASACKNFSIILMKLRMSSQTLNLVQTRVFAADNFVLTGVPLGNILLSRVIHTFDKALSAHEQAYLSTDDQHHAHIYAVPLTSLSQASTE